jgi:hypothetical protein
MPSKTQEVMGDDVSMQSAQSWRGRPGVKQPTASPEGTR